MYFVSLHDDHGRFLAWTKTHPDWPPERLRGLVAWDTTHPEDRALVAREFAAGSKELREFVARDIAGVWYRVKVYPVSGLPPVVVVCVSYSIHRGDRFRLLTARQREVFDLTVEGLNIRDIAKTLGITTQRVANHRSAIRKKLGLPPTAWATIQR